MRFGVRPYQRGCGGGVLESEPVFAIDGRLMSLTIAQAKEILGADAVVPEELEAVLGAPIGPVPALPFTAADLESARKDGALLVYRCARAGSAPVTIAHLVSTVPAAFREKILRGSGYQLKNDWGILLEPLAESDTCQDGWALFSADLLPATRNLAYHEQDTALQEYRAANGLDEQDARRRTAVEAVFDSVAFFAVHQRRLLAQSWDWTSTATEDRGILQVGGFGAEGLEVIGYSPGIRHGQLGACWTRQPNA